MTLLPASVHLFDFLDEEAIASARPYQAVLASLDLTALDWMIIRDLLELGKTKDDLPLIVMLALMLAATHEGSLCLELTDNHLGRLVGPPNLPRIKKLIDHWHEHLKKNRYDHLITREASIHYPLVFETVVAIDRLYFQKYYLHETRLRQQVNTFLSIDLINPTSPQTVGDIINEIFSDERALRLDKNGQPLLRDRDQIAAIRLALLKPFTIISGGPGTGKTSVMVNILRGFVRTGILPQRIALAAPTGRAAQRMTEAILKLLPTIRSPSEEDRQLIALKGSTIHKWLRYSRLRHAFYYHEGNPLPVDVVIIDEVSMVDVVMLAKFLGALNPQRTRLVLMGDKDQLPSVEAGAVFAEMIPSGAHSAIFNNHLVVLQHVYRSGNEIRQLALNINASQVPIYQPISFEAALNGPPDKWAVVAPASSSKWQQFLQMWVEHSFFTPVHGYSECVEQTGTLKQQTLVDSKVGRSLLKRLFQIAGKSKILTLLRRGPSGCDQINGVIESYFTNRIAGGTDPTTGLFSGQIIMVTRNDYEKNLFNGDMGVVLGHREKGFRAYFQYGDDFHDFAVTQLPAWESAFAVTVHKSQGSEFDEVLLVLPDDPEQRMLTSEILYTGITRARDKVVIYGSREAIQTAVSRKIARQSGLVWEGQEAG